MSAERTTQLILWLEESAARIRDLEERARHRIENEHDQQGYASLMREKAMLLAGFGEEAAERLEGDSGPEVERILRRMEKFSASASNALEIGSVFYMSALLYPEEYQPGERNDLESFILSLRTATHRS